MLRKGLRAFFFSFQNEHKKARSRGESKHSSIIRRQVLEEMGFYFV